MDAVWQTASRKFVPSVMEPHMPDDLIVVIGFCAQIVDGALGMAFGVLTTTCLLAFGVPPAQASAMTHATEVFTTAASGLSHAYHKNVDWRLVARLAPAGVVGAVIGATILSNVDGEAIMPFVSAYLMAIGVYIAFKAWRPAWPREFRDWIVRLVGFGGGALDAAGGGGWGPVVTSSLVGRGVGRISGSRTPGGKRRPRGGIAGEADECEVVFRCRAARGRRGR